MRYVPVPRDIILRDRLSGMTNDREPVTFRAWALGGPLNDPRHCRTPVETKRWLGIVEKFDAIPLEWRDGIVVALEDEEHRLVCSILNEPMDPTQMNPTAYKQQTPMVAVQLLPFQDAVLNAPSTDPRTATAAELSPNGIAAA